MKFKLLLLLLLVTILTSSYLSSFDKSDLIGNWDATIQSVDTGRYSNQKEHVTFKKNGEALFSTELYRPTVGKWDCFDDSIRIEFGENKLVGIAIKYSATNLTFYVAQENDNNRELKIDLWKRDD